MVKLFYFGGKMKLRNFLKVLLTSMLAIFMCFALIGCGEKAGGEGTSSDETGNQGGNNSNLQGTHTIYLIDKKIAIIKMTAIS